MSASDDHHASATNDLKQLQKEIELNEKLFHVSINHVLSTMTTNVDQMKILMDRKRTEDKLIPTSMCDLWLRLKTLEQIDLVPLLFHLISFNSREQFQTDYAKEEEEAELRTQQMTLINPKRSRLYHCHILPQSDSFDGSKSNYVGVMVFSYDHQERFLLNGHFSRQGDILIKKIGSVGTMRRGIYQALFKSYFGQPLDERFFGVGFLCFDGHCRFDTITPDHRQLLPYEYRILDMFLLTHWFHRSHPVSRYLYEIEAKSKELLQKQYQAVLQRLSDEEQLKQMHSLARSMFACNRDDLLKAIDYFRTMMEREIRLIFQRFTKRSMATIEPLEDMPEQSIKQG